MYYIYEIIIWTGFPCGFLIWLTIDALITKRKHNKLKRNEIPQVHFARPKKTSSVNTRNKYEIKT